MWCIHKNRRCDHKMKQIFRTQELMNQWDYTKFLWHLICIAMHNFFVKSKFNWSSTKQGYWGDQVTREVILHKKNRKTRLDVCNCSLKLYQLKHIRDGKYLFLHESLMAAQNPKSIKMALKWQDYLQPALKKGLGQVCRLKIRPDPLILLVAFNSHR